MKENNWLKQPMRKRETFRKIKNADTKFTT